MTEPIETPEQAAERMVDARCPISQGDLSPFQRSSRRVDIKYLAAALRERDAQWREAMAGTAGKVGGA